MACKNSETQNIFCGTFHGMAVEFFDKEIHYTNKIDIYSIGVALFELLTGEPPFGYI